MCVTPAPEGVPPVHASPLHNKDFAAQRPATHATEFGAVPLRALKPEAHEIARVAPCVVPLPDATDEAVPKRGKSPQSAAEHTRFFARHTPLLQATASGELPLLATFPALQ